jgi:hypothetical protein
MIKHIIHYNAGGAGIVFPAKTIIIEEEGSFIVISPGPLNPQIIEEFKSTNKNLIFIAPNNFHNLHLKTMYSLFPKAQFYGPKGSAKKSGVPLVDTKEFTLPSIEKIFIEGNEALGETCFFYKPEKKLIVTDLFFNMHHDMNLMKKMLMLTAGTYKKVATSRMIKLMTKDKSLFLKSLQKISELDFDVAIPNHGKSISKKEFNDSLYSRIK